ncbi:nucleoside hydrolase, partial [Klebsiella pneumoniae]|nr:nucleoside hydrolase [Klebsiella pneumoniae]
VNPSFFGFVHRTVNVDTYGDTKGQTFADFRHSSISEGARIALEIDEQKFIQDFMKIML